MVEVLKLSNISKNYSTPSGSLTVLKNVNLTVESGQTIAIVGPSGSGKSTLLHIAGLLDSPDRGTVHVQGQEIKRWSDSRLAEIRNRVFGFVYQQHYLMRDFSSLENVIMPQLIAGKSKKEASQQAQKILFQVGLAARASHSPAQLSGGEQQRVAIARALAGNPKILFADEPTGNLDPKTAADITKLLQDIVKKEKMSAVIVTHNMELAQTCDKVFTMENGTLKAM